MYPLGGPFLLAASRSVISFQLLLIKHACDKHTGACEIVVLAIGALQALVGFIWAIALDLLAPALV